jgi:shikimate dehydrogenase
VLAAVVGFPVAHSRSPAMQNAALAELGLDGWRYLALPLPPPLAEATLRALPASGYAGVNVTIPHKRAAGSLADARAPAAAAIGAANTLTFTDGAIEADNTDAGGFLDALGEPVAGRSALVLGAGGAARAVVWALLDAGAGEVSVWNRTPERARELAGELGARAVERPQAAELLVNATSVGLDPETTDEELSRALPLAALDPPETVVDLVYGTRPTALERWARPRAGRVVDGLEVLVRQGARSLERWTGRPAPIETMRRAARG